MNADPKHFFGGGFDEGTKKVSCAHFLASLNVKEGMVASSHNLKEGMVASSHNHKEGMKEVKEGMKEVKNGIVTGAAILGGAGIFAALLSARKV